jgi:hypothetical protein
MRIGATSDIKLDLGWKTQLSSEQIASINQISASMRTRYGYADEI